MDGPFGSGPLSELAAGVERKLGYSPRGTVKVTLCARCLFFGFAAGGRIFTGVAYHPGVPPGVRARCWSCGSEEFLEVEVPRAFFEYLKAAARERSEGFSAHLFEALSNPTYYRSSAAGYPRAIGAIFAMAADSGVGTIRRKRWNVPIGDWEYADTSEAPEIETSALGEEFAEAIRFLGSDPVLRRIVHAAVRRRPEVWAEASLVAALL